MLQAVEVDGRVIRDIGDELHHDEDIALLAFGNNINSIQFYSGGDDFEFMVSLTSTVRKRINEYDNFHSLIVPSMVNTRKPGLPLVSLNQGPESVRYFSDLFGTYIGLPSTKDLVLLRQASTNLLCWGF